MVDQETAPSDCHGDISQSSDNQSAGSISLLIQMLRKQADPNAAHDLYRRYFDQLVTRLRGRINRKVRAVNDSEDIAQFAMAEVLGKIVEGRYPDLADRESLWALMVHIADIRTRQVWRDATADRRDVRRQQEQMATQPPGMTPAAFDPDCDSIPPEMLCEVGDMVQHLSEQFSKKEYKDILIWELQGYTPAEIKQELEKKLQRRITESSLRRWRRLMREELRASYPNEYPVG